MVAGEQPKRSAVLNPHCVWLREFVRFQTTLERYLGLVFALAPRGVTLL